MQVTLTTTEITRWRDTFPQWVTACPLAGAVLVQPLGVAVAQGRTRNALAYLAGAVALRDLEDRGSLVPVRRLTERVRVDRWCLFSEEALTTFSDEAVHRSST